MKLIFAVLLTLSTISSFSQTSGSGGYSTFNTPTKGDLEGSMYSNDKFSTLKVNGEDHTGKVRYNALDDKMEFSDNSFYGFKTGDELNLIDVKKKYLYADYKDVKENNVSGFLVESQSGKKIRLYKKEKVKFVKGSVAKSSYDKTIPDKYVKEKDVFFLRINDEEITLLPSSRKDFSKLFGDKEKEVMDYLKKNNSSLNAENDLKIVFNYLNTIL
ncbi:hypothetical protein [Moheibacter sediminis]|uniref:Uncharacterized protein n=1 Tax=Moheibacter sediminis TaxID=1434700 RepID=A0A1W1ZNZ6_9FLAO|nr:hypothetical protein [Moheibacter sediminis]SMC50087.1 hypothetical protein SAMN06296427_103122 [Moheibacter sediminis]